MNYTVLKFISQKLIGIAHLRHPTKMETQNGRGVEGANRNICLHKLHTILKVIFEANEKNVKFHIFMNKAREEEYLLTTHTAPSSIVIRS